MKYNEFENVRAARLLHGDDQYSELNNVDVSAGTLGAIVNAFHDGVYEVEFLLPDSDNELYSVVLQVKEEDLAPANGV